MTIKLRDYQQECVDTLWQDLSEGNKRLGVVAPTGSGKTECFIELSQRIVSRGNYCVLILSHLDILTRQTCNRFFKSNQEISVGVLQGRTNPAAWDDVVISTMQSSRDFKKTERFLQGTIKTIKLVIIDECHYLYSNSYDDILKMYPDIPVVGFTATPYRQGKLMTGFFDKISYSISLEELIERGYLVKPVLKQLLIANEKERIPAAIKAYVDAEKGKKAVFFVNTMEVAKETKTLLCAQGVKAEVLISEAKEMYGPTIDRFANGDTEVLVTCNVISAGFDCPKLEAIFMPYVTKSPVLYMQRIGRGLRPYEGKDNCRVYCVGTSPTIKKAVFRKLHNMSVNKPKESPIELEQEYLEAIGEESSIEYVYNHKLLECSKLLNDLHCKNLADMLKHKNFPKIFLKDIGLLAKSIPGAVADRPPRYEAPDKNELAIAKSLGLDIGNIQISKHEMDTMIKMAEFAKGNLRERFIMPSGRFAGQHIGDIPGAYKGIVLRKFPRSPAAELIREYSKHLSKNRR